MLVEGFSDSLQVTLVSLRHEYLKRISIHLLYVNSWLHKHDFLFIYLFYFFVNNTKIIECDCVTWHFHTIIYID